MERRSTKIDGEHGCRQGPPMTKKSAKKRLRLEPRDQGTITPKEVVRRLGERVQKLRSRRYRSSAAAARAAGLTAKCLRRVERGQTWNYGVVQPALASAGIELPSLDSLLGLITLEARRFDGHQHAFYRRAGVSASTVSKWVQGDLHPRVQTLARVLVAIDHAGALLEPGHR